MGKESLSDFASTNGKLPKRVGGLGDLVKGKK